MASSRKPSSHELISPTGAGIIIICFFLPWLRVSCGAKKIILRGSDMGGALYIVLGAAILMILAFAILKLLGQTHFSRYIFCGGSLLAAGTIAYKYITVALNPNIPFYVPEKMVGFELRPGAYGIILGLVLSGLGALLLERPKKNDGSDDLTKGDS